MIKFEKITLDNGLRVIFHQDKNTPIAAVNVLYDVGAKDEHLDKTGFAHLFEHLMFGGSANIPDYDKPLQEAGGSSNAFTNNDITNYYETLPKDNIETAFWLESDRMLSLAFTEKSLEVQKKVVIEEFKQNYLNRPYGDMWLLMRTMAYKIHPYAWATIGKEISHIENANIQDVKDFFYKHYAPNNAIMCITGNFEKNYIFDSVNKWFGDIEKRNIKKRSLPVEPVQTKARFSEVEKDVPVNAFFKTYHMCERRNKEYFATDLLSDILSNGDSSRLYQKLVKEKKVFSNIDAYISGNIEKGLFVFNGKLNNGVSFETAENQLNIEIEKIKKEKVSERELQKIKNKLESKLIFGETDTLQKTMNLAYYELIGKAEDYNTEINKYQNINKSDISEIAQKILIPENSNTIYYKAKKQQKT
ncbi:MAG: insulinase family protein [Bacteroidales bacterium]|nr:insulinase family protein [Bacteroidales bacterium]